MLELILTILNSTVVIYLVFDHWKREKEAKQNFDNFVDEAIKKPQPLNPQNVFDEFVSMN